MQLSIIKITRQKVVYNHLGADSLYFIYHSRETVSCPPHIVNVTIAKAAQMQFACRGDMWRTLVPIKLDGVGDK